MRLSSDRSGKLIAVLSISPRAIVSALVCAFIVISLPASALAAGSVLDDWREDGSIDGNYTVSELQAARGSVSPEELEYSDFDLALRAAISRATRRDTGSSKASTPSTSSNKTTSTGKVVVATKKAGKKSAKKNASGSGSAADGAADGKVSASAADPASAGNTEDSGASLVWFTLFGIMLIGAGFGTYFAVKWFRAGNAKP
jgi:hypothetical protein